MFLKGEFYYKKYSAEGFEKAIGYFKKAVELDPNYADAWCCLGQAHWETQAWLPLQEKSVIEKARNYTKKAIAIDDSVANAHFMLALIYMNKDWDWKKAGAEIMIGNKYNRIKNFWFLPLEPWYRAMLYGDFDFAVSKLQKGIEEDPLSIFYLLHLALIYLYGLHDYEKTRMVLNRILELDSHYTEAWRPMCLSWLFERNYELAEEYARKYYEALEGSGQGGANLIICLAASGKKDEAQQLYGLVNEKPSAFQFSSSLHAKVNASLGKFDEAFQYLDKALEERDIWLSMSLKFSPEWDLIRPDPRFKKVLERMNFPE
jgi:adenylate cyclase